jgi:hypothetical protein
MAQKRMLNKSISTSKQVNRLSLKHKLIFTWAIPHLDDYGRIDSDPEVLKAVICPMVKEIAVKDIMEFIDRCQLEDVGLIEEFKDCLEFTGFDNHQTISEEKRAKSKFLCIPKNPQEILGENNNPQKSPAQERGREEKRREVKLSEGNAPALTPKAFFGNHEAHEHVVAYLVAKGCSETLARQEIRKFDDYWTEPNKSNTRQKWEMQETFDVTRRLSRWFQNIKQFKGSFDYQPKYKATSV